MDVAERFLAAACVTAEVAGGLDAALRLGPPRTMPGKGGGGGLARAALKPGRLLSLGGSEQAMMPYESVSLDSESSVRDTSWAW